MKSQGNSRPSERPKFREAKEKIILAHPNAIAIEISNFTPKTLYHQIFHITNKKQFSKLLIL